MASIEGVNSQQFTVSSRTAAIVRHEFWLYLRSKMAGRQFAQGDQIEEKIIVTGA